jgi:hypothetical protein
VPQLGLGRPDLASLAHEFDPAESPHKAIDRARRHGETAMDYDWFWVLLALGIFIPAGTVPLAMARDACRWWREQRRERGEREIAGPHL